MSIETAIAELAPRFGERLSRAEAVRAQHGADEAHHAPHPPDAVIWPESTAEVAEIARTCSAHGCPIVAWGAGTSLEGHVIPVRGGISLDMSRMDRLLEVHAEDMDVVIQPGITRKRLNEELRATGLFFPVDPGADASLGGMAATRASGTCAVRYGTMREAVLALEVVLADGRVIRTGTRARKSSAGYDLTRLFVGSEGTLGIITELTLRLHGQPEAISAATCAFGRLEDAVQTVIETIQMGVPVARIELLDPLTIRGFNGYSGYDMPELPTLFLEFHGSEASVAEQAETVGAIAGENGGRGFDWTREPEARNRLWAARHSAYYAQQSLRPGARGYVTDVCVPISRLAEAIAETEADLAESPLMAPLVGHVGDGNFHLSILIDPEDPAEIAEAARLAGRINERALRLGGTVTGEHGVGLGKRKYMAAEHGEAWGLMGEIKAVLDPAGILNPGKIVPGN
ncbi:FAD-linked oxidase C-terminal domain-containing protein [Paralimibaculum aggregatum]|uniref:D-lactate dehydrogenase (cytochrome) n=1 Tax=Paralimibaculum aggregatum TaxID=3036245 RepID=A0ABQ6LQN6_9RHOB|nr:FAD-linked oxidase C-terminal domain-containing protein [Limibaculum sp. NKW23]GMG83279.1 FAD-linked oxidase C-terminal domain-containing protein [Limibaculum sp. NKW23]